MDLEKSVVYGPVNSRRFGWDLGINLLPVNQKLCTFDCIYCQYGFSPPLRNEQLQFPLAGEIISAWARQIQSARDRGIPLKHTTLSGNGEPTMHPDFANVVHEIVCWRNQNFPDIKIALLSNGYRLHDPEIRSALQDLDEPIIKLDSAIPQKLNLINGPLTNYSLQRLIENLQKCKNVRIQTMFLKGWNDDRWDVLQWQNALLQIRPQSVQIYTVARDTALPGLCPLSKEELLRIADETTSLLNLPVRAFV
jgi:wyosine [tRNA(Phe)-imidazoG37] synthetase (radical SAM superfamily)